MKAELLTLEERKVELTKALKVPPLLALHPNMAEVFRQKATALQAGLEDEGQRDSARQALRGFVDVIVIPAEGLLQVVGNLGAMLAAGQTKRSMDPVGIVGCGGGI
jgi:site-specific DNA recombinase